MRWQLEILEQHGPMKKPIDLLRRAASSEDVLDSAILGGVSVADILAGKMAESQIPENVIQAFHAQFPGHGSTFVAAVNNLAGDPDRLAGLISGVKGKLFEMDYADWLNHGHLPHGWTAELAHTANNPGWDIAIRDAYGHIDNMLQVKATESLDYVRNAIAAHPEIDVVVPHELYQRLADNPELLNHTIDGHETLQHLGGHVADSVGHAETAGAVAHFPVVGPAIVIGIAVGLNCFAYRRGTLTLSEAFRNIGERGALAVLASASGWVMAALAHEPFVGLPTSIAVRLFGGQFFHNRRRRELLQQFIETVKDSQTHLSLQLQRPLLNAPANAE
jgi:hypothetical protein